VESFRTDQPSLFGLESIEPCVLQYISKKDLEYVLEQSSAICRQIEEQTFLRLIFYQRLFLSRIRDNPQKRYAALLQEHPEIVRRVPQHYIASYLGITPVSLSRMRNRR